MATEDRVLPIFFEILHAYAASFSIFYLLGIDE